MTDIRTMLPSNAPGPLWAEGRCRRCGGQVYGTDAIHAPPEAVTPPAARRTCDYYVWCSNAACVYHAGECVVDMFSPPEWTHEDA